jgi:hypothetical protein
VGLAVTDNTNGTGNVSQIPEIVGNVEKSNSVVPFLIALAVIAVIAAAGVGIVAVKRKKD